MREGFRGGMEVEKTQKRETPTKFRERVKKIVDFFCRNFQVEGKEEVKQELKENPNAKFVIATSHFSNLDAPATVEALGDILDIQVTAESVHFKRTAAQNLLFKLAGKENFTPLSYEKGKGGNKHGVFNPADFAGLEEGIEKGKTPWIAVHPWTKEEEMRKAGIGAIYLAHKSGAMIIPAALEYNGGSVNLEGPWELAKAVAGRKKAEGTYHVGKPIKLLPLDVSIIATVMNKRKQGEVVTADEVKEFSRVSRRLKEDADTVAAAIGTMLPAERRGPYQETPEVEVDEEDIIEEVEAL
ncbi:MAG TPA: hypothetical protein VLK22_02675 [Candidatus Udaeobacter sp.]|nr:hypothetical protein [Candidatus Udaeobacter sp.]